MMKQKKHHKYKINSNTNNHSNIKDITKTIQINKIDFGIAFRINNKIYLNKNLDKYPKLKKAIIKHELEHTSGFGIKDIITDLNGMHLSKVKRQYYKFLFKEKKAWYQFLPLFKVENRWSLDIIMLIVWIIFLLTLGFVIKVK